MATIKSFTDLEQSKKLAEFLSLKSADMHYWKRTWRENDYTIGVGHSKEWQEGFESKGVKYIPCWSLAALLNVLESEIDGEEGETYQLNIEKDGTWWNVWYKEQYDEANPIETESTEELIDACYEMITRLNELNLL